AGDLVVRALVVPGPPQHLLLEETLKRNRHRRSADEGSGPVTVEESAGAKLQVAHAPGHKDKRESRRKTIVALDSCDAGGRSERRRRQPSDRRSNVKRTDSDPPR